MPGSIQHTSRGLKQDMKRRSKQGWERGRGAPKKGNPRYKPEQRTVTRSTPSGGSVTYVTKVYTLRKK